MDESKEIIEYLLSLEGHQGPNPPEKKQDGPRPKKRPLRFMSEAQRRFIMASRRGKDNPNGGDGISQDAASEFINQALGRR